MEECELDNKNEFTLWDDTIAKDMKKINVEFERVPDGKSEPIGYQFKKLQMDSDFKIEYKAQLVAGGHMTDALLTIAYASVVSREKVCHVLLLLL